MRSTARRSRVARGKLARSARFIIAGVASVLMLSSILVPASAFADDSPILSIGETVSPVTSSTSPITAPAVVTFSYDVDCSSDTTECDNFTVTDTIPAPFVIGTVSATANATSTSSISGNSFTVKYNQALDDGSIGLGAGVESTFTVTATLPATASASYDGQEINNPATATASNATTVQTSANVWVHVPTTLKSSLTKTYLPTTLNSTPNLTDTLALVANNTSNAAVTSLTVQDPSTITVSPNPFKYTTITGLSIPTWPGGANRVEVDYAVGTTWTTGTPSSTITLPTVTAPATIDGLRFIFTKSGSGTIAANSAGTVDVALALNSSVTSISANTTVSNTASAVDSLTVGSTTTTSSTVTSTATLTIDHVSISPEATKSYSPASIVGGQNTEATITGTNAGNYTLSQMVITEPATGSPSYENLQQQGLTWGSWDDPNIQWPTGATGATIRYLYYDGTDAPTYGGGLLISAPAAMPEPTPPTGDTTVGFQVTFTGSMAPNSYATLPFTVGTSAVNADTTVTNYAALDVTTTDGQTAEAIASAPLTERTARVNTSITKKVTPTSIYAVAGASTIVSLPAQVAAQPTGPTDTGGSTIGADQLVVQDTADPSTDAFWNDFDVAAIVSTSVPSNSTLTVKYWDGSAWDNLDPATTDVAGGTTLNYTLTSEEQSEAQGLEFIYTPASGQTLPPGFSVQPNIKAVLRATVRGSADAPNSTADTVVVDNTASSTVTSQSAVNSPLTANADASIDLLPVTGGPGIAMISKSWVPVAGAKSVDARSDEQRTAVINWGTGSQDFNSVVIADSADDPSTTPVADTVFDAFNLVKIPAITSIMDPDLQYDEVSGVQLYIPGSGWVDTATNPCASNACNGTFPGYTLTADESAEATGVRLTFIESPTRVGPTVSNPNAPEIGSGVAATTTEDRSLDLVFQLRDTKRSDGSAVLGTSSSTTYNDGSNAGEVVNSASINGYDNSDTSLASGVASDTIQILDQPVDVTATKAWDDGPVGVPAAGTPQANYPTSYTVVTAKNTSTVDVDQLSISDPTDGTDPFAYFNATKIDSITIPAGSSAAQGTVELLPSDDTYSISDALALTANDLADVTGIVVTFTGPISPNATTTLEVDTQLRQSIRGTGDPLIADGQTETTVGNTATASITDPEVGVQTANSGAPTDVTSDDASANIQIQQWNYGIIGSKSITANTTSTDSQPAIQYDGSSPTATVSLTGQPTGNVPTTRMVIEDSSPTFWNAYNFSALGTINLTSPINTVEVDVLVGVTYQVSGNTITTLCNGSTDLDPCWYDGPTSSTPTLPTTTQAVDPLPAGTTAADIRGIRFIFTKSDYSAWGHPFNPSQSVAFQVSRRDDLFSSMQDATPTPVASDLYTNVTPAPGETQVGVYTNTAEISVADASGPTDYACELWCATTDVTAQILYRHLPADVEIDKSPAGNLPLGSDIDYKIAVTNTGDSSDHDQTLTGVVVNDVIPGDSSGTYLVFPNDPDTNAPEDPSDAFSYTMTNGSVTEPAPTVTATVTPATDPVSGDQTETLGFSLAGTLPLGWTLTIQTVLDFRAGLVSGTPVTNTATVTSNQVFDTCDYFTNNLPQSTQDDVSSCTSATTTSPEPSAPLTIIKGVRGVAAGPLGVGDAVLPNTTSPYDDMGVIKTATSNVNCNTTNPALQEEGHGFYTYPCVPITRPGSTEEWANKFINGGNIYLDKIVAIDVLPAVGDTGVIISSARGSKWKATLSSYPQLDDLPANSSYVVEYETNAALATVNCNGADIQTTMGLTESSTPTLLTSYDHCLGTSETDDLPNRNWQTLPVDASASLLASVVAMKFIVTLGDGSDNSGLAPGDSVAITYDTLTANSIGLAETSANLANDSIAWNSIAGAAVGVDPAALPYPFVSEPRKAGVALATGQINLSKLVTGAAASSIKPSTFNFNVSCLSNGKAVQLFNSSGVARNPFTVTPGTPLVVQGIPLYSQCTVTEPTNYGESNSPGSTTVEAEVMDSDEDGSEVVSNPEPAYSDTADRPAIQTATLTNNYQYSDFTVTKTINNGGALDGSGNSVAYQAASFTAKCTLSNGVTTKTTLALTPAFQLGNGQSKAFTNIAVGSTCVVTETNTEGAASTAYTVSANGTTTVPSTSGTADTFVVAANPNGVPSTGTPTNTVAFTNTYTTGSLNVVKSLLGDSTWYTGRSFPMEVDCTDPYTATAAPSYFYTSTFNLTSPGSLTKTISNLPTGSTCKLTETNTESATTSSVSSPVTIGTTTPVTLTATNTYSDASLTVSKVINTSAVDQNGTADPSTDTFAMSVACTFPDAAGDTVPVYGSGDSAKGITDDSTDGTMTFGLTQGTSKTISGLPTRASCTVTENPLTEDADSTTVTMANANATAAPVNGTSGTVTLTADNPSTTNTAVVTNNYGVTSFTVMKELAGDAAAQFAPTAVGSYTLDVVCTNSDYTADVYDGSISLPLPGNVWSKTISDLPENSTCAVTEPDLEGADDQTFVDSDGDTSGRVKSTASTPGSVTVVNWYLTGKLTIIKQVDEPDGMTYGDASGQFAIALDCTRDGIHVDQTSAISNGDEIEFDGLPSGALCTIQETDAGGATSSTVEVGGQSYDATQKVSLPAIVVSHDSSDLSDNQTQTVPSYTIVNTFPATSLVITKTVDSSAVDSSGNALTYGPFAVEVDCTFDGTAVYAVGYSVDHAMTAELAEGQSWTLTDFTPGTICTVEETDAKDATSTDISYVTGADSSTPQAYDSSTGIQLVESDSNHENAVGITNHYDSGTITLTKDVTGDGASDWGNGPFVVNLTCDLNDGSVADPEVWNKDYTISPAETITVPNVASGADCVVAEKKTAGANSTTINLNNAGPSSGTTADFTSPGSADGTFAVVVTNDFDEATVNVTKTRSGAGAALYGGGPFEVSLVCTGDIDGTPTNVPIPDGATRMLDADDFYAASYTGLPSGADCTATEITTGGANSTTMSVNGGAAQDGTSDTLTTDSSTPTALLIDNEFDTGTVSVTKTIAGLGSELYGAGPFETTISCTYQVDGAPTPVVIPDGPTRDLTAANSYVNEYDDLPAGASCDVTESKTGGATSHEFTTTSTAVAVVSDATTAVKLTNEFDLGYIKVDNLVTGNDAASHLKDTYDVVLTCTQQIDGVTTPVLIPDGATRDIWHKTTIEYDNLPVGASCSLVESVTNHAQIVTVMWHGMPVPGNSVIVGDPDFTIHVVNVYNLALGYTGVDITAQLLLGTLALIVGLIVALVPYIRRRRRPQEE